MLQGFLIVVLFDRMVAYFINLNGMRVLKLIKILYLGILFVFEGE
jgi:hypothetical protein